MDAQKWTLIEHLYEEAAQIPEEERSAYLLEMSSGDQEIVHEINKLLHVKQEAGSFFDDFQDALFIKPLPETTPTPSNQVTSALPVNTQILHYEILDKIGQGGMGVVYRARDTRLGREVALKLLHQEMSRDEEARRRFLVEARAASSLNHPHVATIYSIDTDEEDRLVIAMMLCKGGSLKDRIQRGVLSQHEAVQITLQVATGLVEAHKNGIIHRDIKPGNLLFNEAGSVHIVDFGLARMMGESRVTQHSQTMGTLSYMAPEQAKGAANHQSDIWSLGAVLYEMISGQTPFANGQAHAVLYALLNEPVISVAALRPGISPRLAYVINKALEKDLQKRYSQLDEFIGDLKKQLDEETLGSKEEVLADTSSKGTFSPHASSVFSREAMYDADEKVTVKILVVDDEPDVELLIRQHYFKKIRSGEWILDFAENGAMALEKLDQDPEIQIVLTDLHMPVMDGLTLLSRLHEQGRPIKALVLSAYGDILKVRKAMNLGAFDFLFKPIEFDDLEQTIYKTHREVLVQHQVFENRRRLIGLENELDLTRRLQKAVVPIQLPVSDEVSAYAFMQPAQEVSSNFYDVFYLDHDHLAFFIGDVSGEGFPAAILMSMARTLLKADATRGFQPAACINTLNEFIHPALLEGHFITVFYGTMHLKTGEVVYCNAGHPPPFVLRNQAKVEQLVWDGGIGVGVKKDFKYKDASMTLAEEEGLLFFSNGLTQTTNWQGTPYPLSQAQLLLAEYATNSASNLIKHLVRNISTFTSGKPQIRDLTLIAVQRKKVF